MDPIAIVLLNWIAMQTGLSAPPPPSINFVPRQELTTRYFGAPAPDNDALHALYDRASAAIYLSNDLQAEKLRTQGVLLHELVHYVQRVNRLRLPCAEAFERQAFDLQAQWLREQGAQDPYAVMGVDEFSIIQLTACPDQNAAM